MPRPPWTDGWNSFWHFCFGALAVKYPLVVLLFVAYQCLDIYETNILVDLYEFAIGFLVTCVVVLVTFLY